MPSSRRAQRINNALNMAKQTLDTARGPLSLVPIPGLASAASALSALIDLILVAEGNKGAREDAANHIQALVSMIQETAKKAESVAGTNDETRTRLVNSSELKERVATLEKDLKDLMDDATSLETGCLGLLFSKQNADMLLGINKGIEEATRRFQVQSAITVEMLINRTMVDIEQLRRVQQEERAERQRAERNRAERMHAERERELDERALDKLPHVNAGYSSASNPTKSGTLQGTRTALLSEITEWSLRHDTSDNDSFIYVLSGGAGTGKSTIAYEIADRLKKDGALGASFFFISGASDFNTTTYVVTTIAYQLAHRQKSLYPYIAKAAREYFQEGKQGEQLQIDLDHLIIKPLRNVKASHHPIVLVFDALDECTPAAQSEAIRLLFLFMERLPEIPFPVRILVTTRPEMEIEAAFNTEKFRNVSKPFKLHEIPRGIADGDIELFLDVRLKNLSCWKALLHARPGVVKDLTSLAEGLFIYADTVAKFLSKNPRHAAEILDALFSDNPSKASFTLKNLDRLYITVLQNALNDDKIDVPDMKKYIQPVLGSLALLQDQVSASGLKDLVSVPMRFIQDILDRLGSVILKPDNDDVKIRMLHASFPQFLVDIERCTDPKFYINPSEHHQHLALSCLEVMTTRNPLRRNICDLDDPTIMRSKIPGLHDTAKKCIRPSLWYSCAHWATHVSCCDNPSQDILDAVKEFARTKLLVWVEVLSYMNRLEVAVPALLAILSWCKVHIHDADRNEILQLIDDTHRLVLRCYTPINECPEHLYISALPLAPSCMLTIRYHDTPARGHAVKSVVPRDSAWGACLHTILVDAKYCNAVLSPDGRLIASGSQNGEVCIWDANVGVLKRTLTGHTGNVLCVAWAPDRETIASTSRDKTIRVWNATSGAQVHVQDVKGVYATIAWSQDMTRLILGPYFAGGAEVWDVVIGKELKKGMSVPGVGRILAISQDLRRVIDWSSDGGLRFLDMECENARVLKRLHGFSVSGAVFLHDDMQVALCRGNEMNLWDLASGEHTIKVKQKSEIYGIVVSQNGHILALSTADRSVHLLNSKSWNSLGSFQGYFLSNNAAFSPDSYRFLTSYNIGQMWDLSSVLAPKPQIASPTPPLHESRIHFVVVSLDGSRVAAVSNKAVSIWSLKSASLLCIIRGDISGNCAFSPDARRIAVPDYANKTDIWDITTSEPTLVRTISTFNRFSARVAWSPNGYWIAGIAKVNGGQGLRLGVFDAATCKLAKDLMFNLLWNVSDLEFSHDNTMLYAKSGTGQEAIFKWKEGEEVELEQHRWATEIGCRMRLHKDGWIVREEDGKRLCWVEQGSPLCIARWGNYYAVANDSGKLDILHIEESSVDTTKSL